MSLITVICPNCSTSYTVANETLGGAECCKLCGRTFMLIAETRPPVPIDLPATFDSLMPHRKDNRPNELPETFGRYKIERKLDGGGMGTVYLAYDSNLDRTVALKVPHVQFEWYPETIERLLREARAAAAFKDPSFCTVYDIGQIDGRHFIAMEYVEGRPLKALIDPEKPMPKDQAVHFIMSLARAMSKAHSRGVLHRDLKPANVMIDLRGDLVILDFGLALRLESDDPELTSAGQRMGTPHYMAPELVLGDKEAIGKGTDIWAAGVMLYQLLTGELPFQGVQAEVYRKILTESPPPARSFRPDVDSELEAICMKAMEKKVADRYESMADLANDLRLWLSRRGVGTSDPQPQKKGKPVALVACVVVALGLAGVVGAKLGGFLDRKPPVETAQPKPAPPAKANLETARPGPWGAPAYSKKAVEGPTAVVPPAPRTPALTLSSPIGIKLMRIEPGTFVMGSDDGGDDEKPSHPVTISHAFYLGETEVTQGHYQEIKKANPSHFQGSESLPVDSISWFDAVEFCNALSEKEGLTPYYRLEGAGGGQSLTIPNPSSTAYRLPTEAEWEYANRAGATTKYPFGDDPAGLDDHAWYEGNSEKKTHSVAEKRANKFGLHDMIGNVREWCWDHYNPAGYGPVGDGERRRVNRGGSWDSASFLLRSSARGKLIPTIRGEYFGFRVARNDPG